MWGLNIPEVKVHSYVYINHIYIYMEWHFYLLFAILKSKLRKRIADNATNTDIIDTKQKRMIGGYISKISKGIFPRSARTG
jgi:hypothetical protein